MTYSPELAFTVSSLDSEDVTNVQSHFFVGLISDVLRFFESGVTSFDSEETLEVMRLREASLRAVERMGEWISLDSI